ncbi:MAG: ADP-glyceromanno-heptose 6-epimerase [Bacteroidota bacterium]
MIVITGALGFVGSCLVRFLNDKGHLRDLVVVDDFYKDYKEVNLKDKFILEWVHRDIFISWFERVAPQVDFVYHLGARTDTTESDPEIFQRLNLTYSKDIWRICTAHQIPLVYASSAATYGNGEWGYRDSHKEVAKFKPLNVYGQSKQDFDLWALEQEECPPFWAGLKFFNVYGPNELHKKRMASVIFHAFRQIQETGKMKLFRSHREGIADGHQSRDFIYVKDVVNVCYWLSQARPESGLYNVGTGKARTFLALVEATFAALGKDSQIEFIDTPKDIRDNYQYFTEADMSKLKKAGYADDFRPLEEGVEEYVKEYLVKRVLY